MLAGLTGGIGSGKSVVANMLRILGCEVFDSDKVAKDIYFDGAVKPRIVNLLGQQAYLSDLAIDRAYISRKIFSDTRVLQELNHIIHPAVKARFEEFKHKHQGKIIIKETALLFEVNIYTEFDTIIVVAANDELRIKRVMERDGLNREQVMSKIKSQLSQDEKIKKAHFVVHNDETQLVIPQIISIFNQLKPITTAS